VVAIGGVRLGRWRRADAVAAVLEEVLERPATTTISPGNTVPSWMKPEIASAPTFGP
jgi:hypothetical protein